MPGAAGSLFDLDNVAVLKGPQGTLVGRNTTGGAILYNSRTPGPEFGGYVQATVGDYARAGLQGAVNLPLIDGTLAIRIAGQVGSREGYTTDINTGVDHDNRHFRGARIGVLFQPSEALEN